VEVGVAFGGVEKAAVVGGAVLWHAVEVFAEASVEALDHAVGLRPKRPSEAVGDGARGAEPVKGMGAGGFRAIPPGLNTFAGKTIRAEAE
jgi:hypothetical protein